MPNAPAEDCCCWKPELKAVLGVWFPNENPVEAGGVCGPEDGVGAPNPKDGGLGAACCCWKEGD